MRRRDAGVYLEFFAYALGDGTNQIRKVTCSLADSMRLEDVR